MSDNRGLTREVVGSLIVIVGLLAILVIGVLAYLSLWGVTVHAHAQETRLEVDVDTVHRGDPGDLFFEGSYDAVAGEKCIAILESVTNNESIHPGNDLIVGPVTFTNIESGTFEAAGLAFTADGPDDVMVRLGEDGVFSAGFTLEVTCNPPEQPSTTTTTLPMEPSTTTTTTGTSVTTPTLPATTTTLSPPPVGGISTGGGGCADGACDGFSLSPLVTWLGIGVVWVFLAGLYWAAIAGARRRSDG